MREEPVREAVRRPLSYIETSPSLPSPLLKVMIMMMLVIPMMISMIRLMGMLIITMFQGLVWQQGSGIFSRWRERFLVLTKVFSSTLSSMSSLSQLSQECLHTSVIITNHYYYIKDCIRCHKKSSSSCSEYGALLFTLSLVLVSEVHIHIDILTGAIIYVLLAEVL